MNDTVYFFSNMIMSIAFVTYSGCHKIVEQHCQFMDDYTEMNIKTLIDNS